MTRKKGRECRENGADQPHGRVMLKVDGEGPFTRRHIGIKRWFNGPVSNKPPMLIEKRRPLVWTGDIENNTSRGSEPIKLTVHDHRGNHIGRGGSKIGVNTIIRVGAIGHNMIGIGIVGHQERNRGHEKQCVAHERFAGAQGRGIIEWYPVLFGVGKICTTRAVLFA